METYQRLREHALPWDEIDAWMTDERFVPIDHPDNNAAAVRTALGDIPVKLHEVSWMEDPHAAAESYEATLRDLMWQGLDGFQPGLVLLGVGDDGHTASLFPGSPALDETDRAFVANWVEAEGQWRLTTTFPFLAKARRTMFLVTGAHKAEIVAQILEGESDHPAARVSREARDAVWLLDRDAAALLQRPGS